MSPGAPIRRVVTGHDASGRAVFRSEGVFPAAPVPSGDAAFPPPVDDGERTRRQ